MAVCVLIVAVLLPNGAGWAVQAAPAAQENPAGRLPYDGLFELPHLEGAAPQVEVGPTLTEPEYVNWSKLVFQSARNNRDWEIYIARGDGSNQVNISNHSSMDIYPRLNRGATRVVFSSNRHGNYEIFAMNADGSGQTRLTSANGNDMLPAWSPDGSRIAFQAYRDGQAEIYVMNADGSGQTRLTNHGDYDGEPAWSPDGSQIAFVRRASDQYRVWVMNADGSNPRQLSNQAYSENPAWSPDGSQIAYDCDGNGDGWQEIWLMNADGSNQRQVYDPPEYTTDAWVGSWSPDGRYIAFTRIAFFYTQGQWYWTYAYLYAWDSVDTWSTILLSGNGADWNPRWESTDAQAPTSSVHPLATQSPGPFAVAWSGSDAGGSELKNFDVQVRDGAGGAWSNWKIATGDTSGSYPGVGGHTYFFRSRGRDNAANIEVWPASHDAVTTVEALAPQTAVQALPAFSRNGLAVRWGGADPGGSGIQSYDVQVRAGGGAWTDWRMGVSETSAIFTGTAGVEYRFRARARDRAQNVESWPASPDAATTLYTWGIRGKATDNRDAPVDGMGVWTAPPAFHLTLSDGNGAYAAHVQSTAASYFVNWSKGSYGALPSTAFAPNPDAAVDVVLPPADNVVQNWGFESGGSSWQFGGSLAASVTDSDKHSGAASALLGLYRSPLQWVTPLSQNATYGSCVDSVMDATDTIHSVWIERNEGVMYGKKSHGGSWTELGFIPGSNPPGCASIAVDNAGTIHVMWTGYHLSYSQKQPGAGWSTPEIVPQSQSPQSIGADFVLTPQGAVGFIWSRGQQVLFAERATNGQWSSPTSISEVSTNDRLELIRVETDSHRHAHVLWKEGDVYGQCEVYYAGQNEEGAWLPPVRLTPTLASDQGSDMAVGSTGTVHVAWASDNSTYYRVRVSNGNWSPPEIAVSANHYITVSSLRVDDWGTVHLAWGDELEKQVKYARRLQENWSAPVGLAPTSTAETLHPILVVDLTQQIHAFWWEWIYSHLYVIRYSVQGANNQWTPPIEVHQTSSGSIRNPQLLIAHSGTPYATWGVGTASYLEGSIFYAGPELVLTPGEASMSQPIQVPAAGLAPTLSFLHRFDTEFPSDSGLEVVVDDGGASTVVFSTNISSDTWEHQWVDLTPWAGRNVTLRFKVIEEAGGAHAWAYIDEVTVGSAYPDIWVSQPAWQAAPPGRTFGTTVTYGNRGGVSASGGQVTLQLPAELSFVSADPPPSATTPTPRWDVGTLPAQSGPQTIRVTLQVAASAAGGSTVNTTARITSSTTELEQANNTAPGSIYIGSVGYLPVIMR